MTSSNIPDFLSYSATRHASDIFIIAGRPLSVKIDGKLSTYGERLMPADTDALIRQIYQLANNRNIDTFLNTGDDDFSFSVPGKADRSESAPVPEQKMFPDTFCRNLRSRCHLF